MGRPRQFSDADIQAWKRRIDAKEITVTDLAKEVGISRQSIANNLYHRKDATTLPPPTREERANIQHSRERKSELTARPRAPTYDEITDWLVATAKQAKEVERLKNQLALERELHATEKAELRRENERLQGKVNLLEIHKRKSNEFAEAVRDGLIESPVHLPEP